MLRKISSFMFLITLVFPVSPVHANCQDDPEGDFNFSFAQGYQDLTRVCIDLQDGTYLFQLELAEPLPDPLPMMPEEAPPSTNQIRWGVTINTDPDQFIRGFPFSPGFRAPHEYMAFLRWDGENLFADLIDRTPLLDGQEAEINLIDYDLNPSRDTIQLIVPAEQIGNPTQFSVGFGAAGQAGKIESLGFWVLDNAFLSFP